MQLVSQGNKKYYYIEESLFKNAIQDEFGQETITDAINTGVTAASLLAGFMGVVGRTAFKLGSKAFKFTEGALYGSNASAWIIGGCTSIILSMDQYDTDGYNSRLEVLGEDAISDMASTGYGYVIVKTEDFAHVSENGNQWSGSEALVTNIYWSRRPKGKKVD